MHRMQLRESRRSEPLPQTFHQASVRRPQASSLSEFSSQNNGITGSKFGFNYGYSDDYYLHADVNPFSSSDEKANFHAEIAQLRAKLSPVPNSATLAPSGPPNLIDAYQMIKHEREDYGTYTTSLPLPAVTCIEDSDGDTPTADVNLREPLSSRSLPGHEVGPKMSGSNLEPLGSSGQRVLTSRLGDSVFTYRVPTPQTLLKRKLRPKKEDPCSLSRKEKELKIQLTASNIKITQLNIQIKHARETSDQVQRAKLELEKSRVTELQERAIQAKARLKTARLARIARESAQVGRKSAKKNKKVLKESREAQTLNGDAVGKDPVAALAHLVADLSTFTGRIRRLGTALRLTREGDRAIQGLKEALTATVAAIANQASELAECRGSSLAQTPEDGEITDSSMNDEAFPSYEELLLSDEGGVKMEVAMVNDVEDNLP